MQPIQNPKSDRQEDGELEKADDAADSTGDIHSRWLQPGGNLFSSVRKAFTLAGFNHRGDPGVACSRGLRQEMVESLMTVHRDWHVYETSPDRRITAIEPGSVDREQGPE